VVLRGRCWAAPDISSATSTADALNPPVFAPPAASVAPRILLPGGSVHPAPASHLQVLSHQLQELVEPKRLGDVLDLPEPQRLPFVGPATEDDAVDPEVGRPVGDVVAAPVRQMDMARSWATWSSAPRASAAVPALSTR
jgi:hypothetical protein